VLARIAKSAKIIPTQLEFVDIAGLVRGASKGEGLGNKFLANIREVDAVVHVLRCFEDGNVTHVEHTVDPLRDAETVDTELMLADLDGLERRADQNAKKAKSGDKDAKELMGILDPVLAALKAGKPARAVRPADPAQRKLFDGLQLLTGKPVLYVCNVEEGAAATGNALSEKVAARAKAEGAVSVVISAAIEAEVAQLGDAAEQAAFLADLGLKETGLARVIRAGYKLLDLITFFTVGPKEAHAWTLRQGLKAPQAAGVIHTDFEKGFIRSETISYADFVACNGEQGAKDAGKMRLEGKDYEMHDGDVVHFLFNV
jgi:GTP-binding protein YchF